jgi:alkylation response protein AidB-like acyl-CoA dehydrogenase
MFTEAVENILRNLVTPVTIRAIEGGASAQPLWAAFAESGFLELMTSEDNGGAGLSLQAMAPIFVGFGRYAAPLPIAQAIAARVLLERSATAAPHGMITLAGRCVRDADGNVTAPFVPFGMLADLVLGNLDGDTVLLDGARARRAASGVHGSLCGTLTWARDAVPSPLDHRGEDVLTFSAAIHAAALAGAMDRVFAMTLQYCNERSQFGKSIGKFQAVQHQLSVMAQHVAATGMAAELAFASIDRVPQRLPTAIAKARASMAVTLVASTAHALHGAIGVTEEYDLQLYTRRMHEWRMADGSEIWWNRVVGQALLAQTSSVSDFIRGTVDAVVA